MSKEVKKVSIGEIGKDNRKITIADEVEIETSYHLEPALTPFQIMSGLLDPSELDMAREKRVFLKAWNCQVQIPGSIAENLKMAIKPIFLEEGSISFAERPCYAWTRGKSKIMRKFNLSGFKCSTMVDFVHNIAISSRQPLYDQDAHSNRVRNVLRALKVRYPQVHFEHEGCLTSGTCPIGLQSALRKLAEEGMKK